MLFAKLQNKGIFLLVGASNTFGIGKCVRATLCICIPAWMPMRQKSQELVLISLFSGRIVVEVVAWTMF